MTCEAKRRVREAKDKSTLEDKSTIDDEPARLMAINTNQLISESLSSSKRADSKLSPPEEYTLTNQPSSKQVNTKALFITTTKRSSTHSTPKPEKRSL